MLFLAVFCGFLAEWQLEHAIENHREKEYIASIVVDIKADVEQTDKLIGVMNTRIDGTDSLLTALSSKNVQANSNEAYRLWGKTMGFPDFVQNDRTIQQLKSTGALRTIRNKAVSDKIMEYDQAVRLLSVTQGNMNAVATNTTLFYQLFDFIQLTKNTTQAIPLTEGGKKLLNEAYASRFFWKLQLVNLRQRLTLLNQKGKETCEFIKKQYSLK